MAVLGTTELIDSLLIFSRTGGEPHRTRESILLLLEKAVAWLELIRMWRAYASACNATKRERRPT